jgi:hypothetical protein
MSALQPAPKFKRRIKLIKPGLQLKLVAMFAGVSASSLLLQYMLFAARFSEVASTLPDGGSQVLSVLPGILMQVLAMSFAFLLPVMLCVGILATFRIAGPVYRFEQYLKQVARGEVTEPCRIRDGDELWDLCDLINEATAPLRHKTAGIEPASSATTLPVPLEEPAAPLASGR